MTGLPVTAHGPDIRAVRGFVPGPVAGPFCARTR